MVNSVLDNLENVEIFTSMSEDKASSLLSSVVNKYDSNNGFMQISNPGWIKIRLKEAQSIRYLRFLLWDNRGSEGKRQPSRREYTYRLLISEADAANNEWTAIYENTLNPTNGWQEFYFESGAKMIKAIKIDFYHNTSRSSSHSTATQLVSIQAFEQPTQVIANLLYDESVTSYAPLPNLGFMKNRVIIGDEQQKLNLLVEEAILSKIKSYLDSVIISEEDMPYSGIEQLKARLNSKAGNNDIEKQINIFNTSILRPVYMYSKKLAHGYRWYTIATIVLFGFGILSELVDAACLWLDVENPLSLQFIFQFIVGLFSAPDSTSITL